MSDPAVTETGSQKAETEETEMWRQAGRGYESRVRRGEPREEPQGSPWGTVRCEPSGGYTLANARQLGTDMATEIVTRELREGKTPDAIWADNEPTIQAVDEKATTAEARAFAEAFSWTTQQLVRDAAELEAG